MTAVELKLILVSVLMALGVAAPMPDFFGGMLLGLGGSYAGMLFTPPHDRLTLWATLFAGLTVCILTAIAHPHLPFGVDHLPLQLVMMLGGLASRWLGGIMVEFGKGGMERARKLPSEFKLPGSGK